VKGGTSFRGGPVKELGKLFMKQLQQPPYCASTLCPEFGLKPPISIKRDQAAILAAETGLTATAVERVKFINKQSI